VVLAIRVAMVVIAIMVTVCGDQGFIDTVMEIMAVVMVIMMP
jgi:hypothetical protein